jgi:hypothetical protein
MFQKLVEIIATWLIRQETTTVLLFLHLASVLGIAFYVVNVGVPLYLQMIQAGYEKIERLHDSRVHDILEEQDKQFGRLIDMFNRELRKEQDRVAPNSFKQTEDKTSCLMPHIQFGLSFKC